MMRKLSVYLDTSVVNFLFADDAPEKQATTVEFFERCVKKETSRFCISPVVADEIQRTPDPGRRADLLAVLSRYPLHMLDVEGRPEIQALALALIHKGVIPVRKPEDALHLAVAVVHGMDVLASWNYKHLANINKERRVADVCLEMGYARMLRMTTPLEVMGS